MSAPCVKCGGDDILVRWHSTGGRYGQGGCGYHAQVVEDGEHLHYTCRTCQFEWVEPSKDAASRVVAANPQAGKQPL